MYQTKSVPVTQGYAAPGQLAAGIHTRLHARAYVIGDAQDKRCFFLICIYLPDVELECSVPVAHVPTSAALTAVMT